MLEDVALERGVRAGAGEDEVVVAGRGLDEVRELAGEDPRGRAVDEQRDVVVFPAQPRREQLGAARVVRCDEELQSSARLAWTLRNALITSSTSSSVRPAWTSVWNSISWSLMRSQVGQVPSS